MLSWNALKRLSSWETDVRLIRTENQTTQTQRFVVYIETHCITTESASYKAPGCKHFHFKGTIAASWKLRKW